MLAISLLLSATASCTLLPHPKVVEAALPLHRLHDRRAAVKIRHQIIVAPRTVVSDYDYVPVSRRRMSGPPSREGRLLVRVDDDRQAREVLVDPEEPSTLPGVDMDGVCRTRADGRVDGPDGVMVTKIESNIRQEIDDKL